jgi:hypothetical protein
MQDPSKPIWVNPKQEIPKKEPIKIFLATPVHSEASIHYVQSLLTFQQKCMMNNILVSFSLMKSSLVTQGRNLCVSAMFEDPKKYDYLLFIDSDIEFSFDLIIKMINKDKDVIACPYPLKAIDWNKLHKSRIHRNVDDPEMYSKYGYTWPIKLEDRNSIEVVDGVAEVSHAPTGCMLIKRNVFEKMMEKFPELKIVQPTILNGQMTERPYFYNFFDTYHEPETKRYYGEDFGFCKRWAEAGGKCHIIVSEDYISHIGEYRYTGRIIDDLTFATKNVDESNKN